MVESVIDPARLRRFSVEEYHRMGAAGVFGLNERVELIRGVIRQMSPKGRRHIIAVSKATELFVLAVAGRARVYVQDPMASERLQSEPEERTTASTESSNSGLPARCTCSHAAKGLGACKRISRPASR